MLLVVFSSAGLLHSSQIVPTHVVSTPRSSQLPYRPCPHHLRLPQLLQVSPARRMSAAVAAEHPFLGPASKVPPRQRAARAEVAAVQTERAAAAAQRHKARLQQQEEGPEGKPTKASAAAAVAAATALSDIAVLASAMSDEARSLLADTKRWDKVRVGIRKLLSLRRPPLHPERRQRQEKWWRRGARAGKFTI